MTLLSFMLVCFSGNKVQAQDVSVSYQTFYDELAPYGQWVNDPEYGNVWVPNEGGDFRPYGNRGHWVMTEYGNTWVSEDPWGWACYHYGRWTYNPYYGWIWVPGYEWAPAWVSWRFGGGYCGWAPLAPGYAVGSGYGCPDSWWVFVGPQYMYRDNCISFWRGPSYNREYMGRAHFIENVYEDNGTHVRYNYGPRATAIEAVTHQPVQVYRVAQTNRPGAPAFRQNTVSLYRPTVNRATENTARPANVMQAPRSIGKPQAATEVNAGRQPAFRQEIQRNPGNTGVVGPRNNNNQPNTRPENARPEQGRPVAPQPQPQQQPRPQQPQQNRPEPQHFNQPQQQPQPQPRPQQPQQYRPDPQHFKQPQQQPQPQPRPQQPQQQPRPQPQQQQPRPQPQQARPQPQPQQHEGGGRR